VAGKSFPPRRKKRLCSAFSASFIDLITVVARSIHDSPKTTLFSDMNEAQRNMAPQNSTLINLINDDVKSITSERMSPIEKDVDVSSDEVRRKRVLKTPQ